MLLENKAALYTMRYQNRLLNLQPNITQAISSFHASATYIKSKEDRLRVTKQNLAPKTLETRTPAKNT